MKISRQDIGGELISIITKGMYSDPKDALREYVQNGIDANAKNVSIKIRFDSITIADNGAGMNSVVLRRAVRVGISDKNPSKSVGFMGIGLYSSFHLCDILTIYSKVKDEKPNKLVFRFMEMREYLQNQKDIRIGGKANLQQQIDLQTLLEKNIDFEALEEESFPKIGTRIEMRGIEANFFKSLSKFEEVAEYLESVVPLPFSSEFSWGETIQDYIDQVCKKHKTSFKIINLVLDINATEKQLFRPYKDIDFVSNKSIGMPMAPEFYELKNKDEFLGVAWACLNEQRDTIPNAKVRGFIIKKQGFTIGKRSDLIPHFGRQTYFNRAVGEFLVLHPKLLPNAPRSDFEYSNLRTSFYAELKIVAKKFTEYATEHQESEKAEDDLQEAMVQYNEMTSQLEFFEFNSDKLLEYFGYLSTTIAALEKKVDSNKFRKAKEASEFIKKMQSLRNEVKAFIDNRKSKSKTVKRSANAVIKKLVEVSSDRSQEPMPDAVEDIILSLGFELTDDLLEIIKLIDEKFIRSASENKEDYKNKLIALRNEIDELFDEH